MSVDHEYTSAAEAVQRSNLSRCIQQDALKKKGIDLLNKSKAGDVNAVKELLENGAPFLSDAVGSSPMHWSVKNKHHAVTELLLKGGIPRNVRNKVNRTPLHIAAELGDSLSTQLLLEYGAETDLTDIFEMRPLHWGAQSGDIKTVRLLLDYGADFTATNKFGKTASDVASKMHNYSVVRLIQEFNIIDRTIRAQKTRKLKQQVKPAVPFISNGSNNTDEQAGTSVKNTISDRKFEKRQPLMKPAGTFTLNDMLTPNEDTTKSFKRKFSDLEEESKSGDEDLLDKVSESALQQLKSHGINLLESLHDSTLRTAIQRGGQLVLTEAGKLALSSFDKLFPGRNLPPPPPAEMVVPSTAQHAGDDAYRKAKEEELRIKKENLKRQISYNKSQAQSLRNKLKLVENRIISLEDDLKSLENGL